MGKPSIFSNNYTQQRKKRKLNIVLFILLIISISFFGGKYYLRKHDVPIITNIVNSRIVQSVSNFDWISQIKNRFAKKENVQPTKPVVKKNNVPVVVKKVPSVVIDKKIYEYPYLAKDGEKYAVQYQKNNSKVVIIGLKDASNTSEYSVLSNKSMIVFDIKSESSLILCDNLGNFKVLSAPFYKTKSTHKILTKEAVMSSYPGFIWAQKPCFTMDGRVIYVSRLPYIRADKTLYLWCINIDGSVNKKIAMLNKDINKVSFNGFDDKKRLKVTVEGTQYYIDNGSYMLRKY